MAFLLTSANDLYDLMGKVKSFASGQGFQWPRGQFNQKADYNKGIKQGYLTLAKNDAAFYFQHGGIRDRNLKLSGGTIKDAILKIAIGGRTKGESNSERLAREKEHKGEKVIASGYGWVKYDSFPNYYETKTTELNDLAGPFANVWLFGDGDSVWVVVESAPDRYTHFGFGSIDQEGMTTPKCGFIAGTFYNLWEDSAYLSEAYANDVAYDKHRYYFRDEDYLQVYVPDGVLDKTYFPGDYPTVFRQGYPTYDTALSNVMNLYVGRENYLRGYGSLSGIMDFFPILNNFNTTGGIPLVSVPIILRATTEEGLLQYWFGRYPNMRFVNVSNILPGETVKYQNDEWICFPLKQRGFVRNAALGVAVNATPNSLHFGVAFKKSG